MAMNQDDYKKLREAAQALLDAAEPASSPFACMVKREDLRVLRAVLAATPAPDDGEQQAPERVAPITEAEIRAAGQCDATIVSPFDGKGYRCTLERGHTFARHHCAPLYWPDEHSALTDAPGAPAGEATGVEQEIDSAIVRFRSAVEACDRISVIAPLADSRWDRARGEYAAAYDNLRALLARAIHDERARGDEARGPHQHDPVLFHLDDGKVARAVRIGGSGNLSFLVVDLTSGDGPSVVGKPDWFDAGYVAAYGGLVPECAEEGTEPGQWSYGVLKTP